ncbi:MAG: glycosyltransferase family 1 protein [Chloroflexota bacterium]|nr:MAG: glycosyltransferase family 1 protein [Chloroflexota bacterium]
MSAVLSQPAWVEEIWVEGDSHMIEGRDIVCLASANWASSNRVNCHLLMERLATKNRVLFVETPGARTPAPRELGRAFRRVAAAARGIRKEREQLWVLPPLILPKHSLRSIRWLNKVALRLQVQLAARRLGLTTPILWSFLPYGEGLIGHLSECLTVYHCVDNYAANPGVHVPSLVAAEERLLRRADVVLTTAPALFDAKRLLNANTHYWPNAANTDLFETTLDAATTVAPDIAAISGPRIGYVGNLASYKLDLGLLRRVAADHPEWSFVLIGPEGIGDPSTDLSALRSLSNVHFLGPRSYETLPSYLKGMDVCMIPFQVTESTTYSFPMKFFEYLASGRPVVSTGLPALERFRHLFRRGDSPEEFARAIRESLDADTPKARESRLSAARSHGWDGLVEQISAVVSAAQSPAAGVTRVRTGEHVGC